jgi:hypothetical protein
VTFAAITLCVAIEQVSVVVVVVAFLISLSIRSGNFSIHPRKHTILLRTTVASKS